MQLLISITLIALTTGALHHGAPQRQRQGEEHQAGRQVRPSGPVFFCTNNIQHTNYNTTDTHIDSSKHMNTNNVMHTNVDNSKHVNHSTHWVGFVTSKPAREGSGVHKGGFSKGGFSNLCISLVQL